MNIRTSPTCFFIFAGALLALALPGAADHEGQHDGDAPAYSPHAAHRYGQKGVRYPEGTIRGEALDEAKSGRTLRGTPVTPRTAECFPAEPRDLFWKMDMVASGENGKLQPLNFDENGDGTVDDAERDAIRGRNTWLVWGGGNETFWGWLQEQGYGLTDFLILMDSRKRGSRFRDAGLINQPGFQSSARPLLGLYLDVPKEDGSAVLRPPGAEDAPAQNSYTAAYRAPEAETVDAQGRPLPEPVNRPGPPPGHPTALFKPWTTPEARAQQWEKERKDEGAPDPFKDYVPEAVRARLAQDGLDPTIYGYPSGIFGLRLWLNPDFFADTREAGKARRYWRERVETTNGRYYHETGIHADPQLIRPFKVSMSCGFCHVAQHPLNPPLDDENPAWENLSSIIGAQYWDPQPVNGTTLKRPNFLHHFLKSQAPGTIDTSLVSTDQINNTNVINSIFDVPARLARAKAKPTETQSADNLRLPSIENPGNHSGDQRHFPMVLFPGEDSVGTFGALARVYLNIGLFSEQWARSDNQAIGFTPQRPFRVEVCQKNSVYWNVNEKYRVGYLAKFFTLGTSGKVAKSTAPMKLKDAGPTVGPKGEPVPVPDGRKQLLGKDVLAADAGKRTTDGHAYVAKGREVFIQNCAICHSSKQPDGFDLRFARRLDVEWAAVPAPAGGAPRIYTLPMEYGQPWEDFKRSPAYRDYLGQISQVAGPAPADGGDDPFLKDNFLSTELRIPATLIGTYSGRAMATNAMRGQVWDNFSSETFKNLPSVGMIRFYNPFSKAAVDPFGTNDEYSDGREKGGPGYLRPPTLISLWATAPFLHNNALGHYTHDPSVEGRLVAFEDGIRKLLWDRKRKEYPRDKQGGIAWAPPGDLRAQGSAVAANDPGYIYRVPVDTFVLFQPGFIRPLIEGVLVGYLGMTFGIIAFKIVSFWSWFLLAIVLGIAAWKARARHAGIFLLLLAVVLAAVLALTGAGGVGGTTIGAVMMTMTSLLEYSSALLWLVVAALAAAGFLLLMTRREWRKLARIIFLVAAVGTLLGGLLLNKFLTGHLKEVNPLLAWLPNNWFNADYKGVRIGPIPRGTPVNLLMNIDPEKRDRLAPALVHLLRAMKQIKKEQLTGEAAYAVLAKEAGPALIAASKVPDMVLDRGHWFGELLTDEEKETLIAFLKTL